MVFIDQLLHALLPADVDALPRLLSAVGEVVALQVAFLQVGDVCERHAAGVETEQEDVAREVFDVAGSVLEGYTKETDVKGDIVSTDTIKQAFNKIENNIEANELVTSASLNELNTRIEEINAKLTQINNTIASLQQAQTN